MVRPPERVLIEEVDGEEFLHKSVWRIVGRQMEHAQAHPKGAQMDHLVAMVFASHALEGYANFLGQKIAPDLWADERERFRTTGLAGKLDALHERCGLPLLDRGRRPWTTIRGLKDLRDTIAHPRTKTTRTAKEYVDGKEPPLFAAGWTDNVVSKTKAMRAAEDVKAIADQLHLAALAAFPRAKLLPDAMDGILSMRSTTARLKE